MKIRSILIVSACLLFLISCEPIPNYTQQTVNAFNQMTPPVTLVGKSLSLGHYSVSLIDSSGTVYHFGNMSTFANGIGESYNIGDTIKD